VMSVKEKPSTWRHRFGSKISETMASIVAGHDGLRGSRARAALAGLAGGSS
jgi:hypothetical protein